MMENVHNDIKVEEAEPDFEPVIDEVVDDFYMAQLISASVTGLLANATVPNNPVEIARMAVAQANAVMDE